MNEVLKKPYEISLWKEQLIYHRRKLVPQTGVTSDTYKPGVYYSQNESNGGENNTSAIPYTLDYGDYVQNRKYYSLAPWTEDNVKEGSAMSDSNANWEPSTLLQYYKETRVCTIGSNNSESPIRAINPKLVTNVNGSNTLTFTMYYMYWDEITNRLEWNPYMQYLTNERKVKLQYNGEWYDFVIKNISEDSASKAFTYTCKDLFVNELSKSGFDVELSQELGNNMNTLPILAEKILEGSDWQVQENNLIVRQYLEEPLYEIKFNQSVELTQMYGQPNITQSAQKDHLAYVFHSSINDTTTSIQLLYDPQQKYIKDTSNIILGYSDDDTTGIYNYMLSSGNDSPFWTIEDGLYTNSVLEGGALFCPETRGKRIVKSPQKEFDTKTKKTVTIYSKVEGAPSNLPSEVYGYIDTEYISPTSVTNLVVNSTNYTNDSGWYARSAWDSEFSALPGLELYQFPELKSYTGDLKDYRAESYLKLTPNKNKDKNEMYAALLNTGINYSKTKIGEFLEGQKYILRIKVANGFTNGSPNTAGRYDIVVSEYDEANGKYQLKGQNGENIPISFYENNWGTLNFRDHTPLFTRPKQKDESIKESFKRLEDDENNSFDFHSEYTCNYSIPQEELKNKKIGIFVIRNSSDPLYVKDLQFFKHQLGEKESGSTTVCYPGAPLKAIVTNYYSYYDQLNVYENPIPHIYRDTTPWNYYTEKYGAEAKAYEKVRSITAKESNRFNLIQELCELFECWARFTIDRNPDTGEILLDENCRQRKWVSFHEYVGKQNFVGFRYGTNLKSIKRTLDSNGAISKIIVKNNSNEFAKNGFCSISKAEKNPSGENAIYNFDYYVGQKLLSFQEVNQDLNAPKANVQGYLALYDRLKELNIQAQSLTEKLSGIVTEIAEWESTYTTYKSSYDAAETDWADQKAALQELTKLTEADFIPAYQVYNNEKHINPEGDIIWRFYETTSSNGEDEPTEGKTKFVRTTWWDNDEAEKILVAMFRDQAIKQDHKAIYENAQIQKTRLVEERDNLQANLESIKAKKIKINKEFYKKYSRFIQEGSWISEDYIDDDLYYIDALSTLYTSSRPKVTYTIETIELSALEEYKNFVFSIGDKTFVEDEEFFGWSHDGTNRKYREEVIVSEITTELDSPENNKIKVQNYKTQFEDLFQRVAAVTAQVEFSTGEYKRGSQIIEKDGTIAVDVLQNSINNNEIVLQNINDQSVIIDKNGITITDMYRPNEQIRLVSGGIFLTTTGGAPWIAGITARGINASCLTTGTINASKINITMGGIASFRWDEKGITAYRSSDSGISNSTFVRFDQYGLYGIEKQSNFDASKQTNPMAHIKQNASFGLTWNDFWLKSSGVEGYTEISKDNDFQIVRTVTENEVQRDLPIIQIGRLKTEKKEGEEEEGENDKQYYGLRINKINEKDGVYNSVIVMETTSSGELTLKEKLWVETNSKDNSVQIGKLGNQDTSHSAYKVIDASGKFKVFEDGHIECTSANIEGNSRFKGRIEATGGTIGGLDIAEWKDMGYSVLIDSDQGPVLKNSGTELTAKLYHGTSWLNEKSDSIVIEGVKYGLSYCWFQLVYQKVTNEQDEEELKLVEQVITNENTKKLSISLSDLDEDSSEEFFCKITLTKIQQTEQKEEKE